MILSNHIFFKKYPTGKLIVLAVLISSCSGQESNSSNSDSTKVVLTEQEFITGENTDLPPPEYDFALFIYKYDSTFTDSSIVYKEWRLNNMLVKKSGEYLYQLPMQSDFVDESILESANGETEYSTFHELQCEVGGQSAYNKYLFKYDSKQRIILVKHYKAWYEGYDDEGNSYTNETPDYFLNDISRFTYSGKKRIQTVEDADDGEFYEMIVTEKDSLGRLTFSEMNSWNEHFYRAYYQYEYFGH